LSFVGGTPKIARCEEEELDPVGQFGDGGLFCSLQQRITRREVPVQRGAADARLVGDVGHRRVGTSAEHPRSGFEDRHASPFGGAGGIRHTPMLASQDET